MTAFFVGFMALLFHPHFMLAHFAVTMTFAFTVVAVPLLVDRDVTTPMALKTSIRAVAENPVPMTLWALLILVMRTSP